MTAKLNAPVRKDKEAPPPADELVDITGEEEGAIREYAGRG